MFHTSTPRLFIPQETPSLLASSFKIMSALIAHPDVTLQGVNVKVLNVMEGFLEVQEVIPLQEPLLL